MSVVATAVAFLTQTVLISMSGVLAPGPVTAATVVNGARRRHAGAWVAIGHGVIEFPLMFLILAGAGAIMRHELFRTVVGLAGGVVLLGLAVLTLLGLRRQAGPGEPVRVTGPLATGIVLTAGNPYFLVWWATVGLDLATQAIALGVLVFVLFACLHWLCDLAWLEALSLASNRGSSLLGRRSQPVILILCAAVMGVFGVRFIWDALAKMLA